MNLTPARLIFTLILGAAAVVAYVQLRSDWVELDERTFAQRVLEARVPALVYFDTAAGCRGADTVFRRLGRERRGALEIFYVNSATHPELARAHGVAHDVVFLLFDHGQVVKRATAPMILASVTANNQGVYSDDAFLAEMERFARLR